MLWTYFVMRFTFGAFFLKIHCRGSPKQRVNVRHTTTAFRKREKILTEFVEAQFREKPYGFDRPWRQPLAQNA